MPVPPWQKCLVVKCLGIPNLIYSASVLPMPNTYVPSIKDAIFKFIWNNKRDKIKRDVMYQDYPKGGLRAPNIDILFKSLNLAWIQRLLTEDPLSSETLNQFRTTSLKSMVVSSFSSAVIMTKCF